MTDPKIKRNQPAAPAAKPAAKAPPKAPAGRPPAPKKPAAPGTSRIAGPSRAMMPLRVNLGRVMLPDNTRVAMRWPTFPANQQRAQRFALPRAGATATIRQAPRKPAPKKEGPGLLGKLWGEVKNVGRGARDAVVDTVKGTWEVVKNPKQTVKAIVHLAKNPGQIKDVAKQMWKDATKHGVGYAVGYIGANLVPTLLSGGAGSAGVTARLLSVAGKTRLVTKLARVPAVTRSLAKVGQVGGKVAKAGKAVAASRPGQAIGRVAQAGKARLATPAARLQRVRQAIANQRHVKAVAKGYRVAKQPVEKLRAMRNRVLDRAEARLARGVDKLETGAMRGVQRAKGALNEHRMAKATARMEAAEAKLTKALRQHPDKGLWLDPQIGPWARKLDAKAPLPANNPDFAAEVRALEQVHAARPRAGVAGPMPGKRTADPALIRRYDEAFERMAMEDPARLADVQRRAYQAAGLSPAEARAWDDAVHAWTLPNGQAGVGAFADVPDFQAYFREANRLYRTTGDRARALGEAGVYAREGGSFGKHLADASAHVDVARLSNLRPDQARRLTELAELARDPAVLGHARPAQAAKIRELADRLGDPTKLATPTVKQAEDLQALARLMDAVEVDASGATGQRLAAAVEVADQLKPPTPRQLEQLQQLTELTAKERGTREARRAFIAEELGLPKLDATHVELHRGSTFKGHVADAYQAIKNGDAHVTVQMRHGDSFSASLETANDFARGGPASSATQARAPEVGSVIMTMDTPVERIITDKYLDMGAHALRERAQRGQMEFVLQFDGPARISTNDVVIQFKGQYYTSANFADLEAAIKADPKAWKAASGLDVE